MGFWACGYSWLGSALIGAALAATSTPAQAQFLLDQLIAPNVAGVAAGQGVTVQSRARPEYDPLGIQVGEFTIRPELNESVGLDDNVLGQASHRASAVAETNAVVNIRYDHSDTVGFSTLTVDDNRYPEQNQQSYTNWTVALGGSHEFGRDTLSLRYEHLNLNQTVRELDVPDLDQALAYRVDSVRLDYKTVFNRLSVDPGITVSKYDFDNGTVSGQPYLQTYRDRVLVQPDVTLAYELAPQRNLVLVLRDGIASYFNQIAGSPRRDYNDIEGLGGLDLANGVLRYRLLVGYENRTFTSAQIKAIQAPVVEAEVIWNPTGLTTVTGTASRRVLDSADDATVGVVASNVGLRVDHELRRDILLRATGGVELDDYGQNQGNQQLFTAGVGATKLLNRNMQVGLGYDFTRRNSSGLGSLGVLTGQSFASSFSENRIVLMLQLAM